MPIPSDLFIERTDAPARESVLCYLRDWIVEGTLQPGEIIRDSEIAQAFGVSRTPVREALLQLRFEGLVVMKPKGWTQVKPLDRGQIEDIFRVVVDLEMLAARLAAEQPVPDITSAEETNAALEALLDQYEAAPASAMAWQLIDVNDRFHDAILDIAGNDVLADALKPIKARMRRYERIYFDRATPIDRSSIAQHRELLAAIRAGDGDAAAAVAARNLENSPLRARESRPRHASPTADGARA